MWKPTFLACHNIVIFQPAVYESLCGTAVDSYFYTKLLFPVIPTDFVQLDKSRMSVYTQVII